ncbi:MAG: transporter, ATP-binding/permease protein [Herbinix sp.]|nr:transporter, ATP-binding/permease protein [Herbinix sp.]
MFKLMKFLKKSVVAILFVTILLILQAACDLSLPTYTSDIVNIGITQGGIDSAVPEVIRKSELDKITLFMTESEKTIVLPHYSLLQSNDYSETQWSNLLKKYPLASSEEVFIWDNEEEETLSDALSIPMMLVLGLEGDSESSVQMREGILANIPPAMVQENADIFDILTALPTEGITAMVTGMRDQVSKMPEMILKQSAISYVKTEYKAIGVDVNQRQVNYILLIGAKMLGLALAAMIASILVSLLASRIAAKMGRDLRSNVFQKVLSFSNKEMDQFSTASLITRSTNDIQQVQMLLVMLIRIVIYAPILALGGIIKVLNTNNSMSWILVVGVGTIFVVIAFLFAVAMPKFKIMQKLVDRLNLVMREIITGLPVIRAFSTVDYEQKRFDKANVDITKNSLFVNRVMTFMMPILMLIMNLISILILWVGAHNINDGNMQIGDMIAFIQYTMQIIMSFLMLTMVSVMLPRATVAAKRIDEILSTDVSIKDITTNETFNPNLSGVLEFRNVSFRYPNAEEDVLSNINFTAKPGETTAIIGSTGSGKSTLINLIPRFYDATAGSIFLDGVDITKVKQHALREKLGFIPQKGVLFTGTIESNINFGNASAPEEEMKRAARIAQAEEFIDSKPEGYQTPIAQGGTNVSGGQKQRLSIARAIARNPEVYVFDDSFSALDYKTDATLRKTIKEEISNSTILIVAQRISTIMSAEQILVLDDGRIVGKGTHKELLKNCEVYQQIASSQLSKEELEHE